MSVQNGSFIRKEIPFSQIPNIVLRDKQLSLKAKGLYNLIQSYITLPDFTLYKHALLKQCAERETAFNSAWKELKEAGYLKEYRQPSHRGFAYFYELLDSSEISEENPIINLKADEEVPTSEGGAFIRTEIPFSQIPNIVLRDTKLSLKAKGLYSLIQSYITLPDFTLYKWYLIQQCKEGKASFDSAWRELKEVGYLKQCRQPSDQGCFTYYYKLFSSLSNAEELPVNVPENEEIAKSEDETSPQPEDISEEKDLESISREPCTDTTSTSEESTYGESTGRKPTYRFSTSRKSTGRKPTPYNNIIYNNTESNNIINNNTNSITQKNIEESTIRDVNECLKTIHETIDYENWYLDQKSKKLADIVIDSMVQLCILKRTHVRIKHESIPTKDLREMFLAAPRQAIDYVMNKIQKNTDSIHSLAPYIWACLYQFLDDLDKKSSIHAAKKQPSYDLDELAKRGLFV